jgi:hypothetical protein
VHMRRKLSGRANGEAQARDHQRRNGHPCFRAAFVARARSHAAEREGREPFHETADAGNGATPSCATTAPAADGSGQLGLLSSELERGEFRGDFHPVGEFEPDRPFFRSRRWCTSRLIDRPLIVAG